jgi:hypothetical protein
MLKEGEKEEEQSDHHIIMVLVKDTGNKSLGLLSTLRERIGFSNLAEISRGIFWKMHIDAKNTADAKEIAEKITKDLLYNTHYQEYEIVE